MKKGFFTLVFLYLGLCNLISQNLKINDIIKLQKEEGKAFSFFKPFDIVEASSDTLKLKLISGIIPTIYNAPNNLIALEIPINASTNIILDLYKVNLYSGTCKILEKNENGDRYVAPTNSLYYRGVVRGEGSTSLAVINIHNSSITGVISYKGHDYNVGSINNSNFFTVVDDALLDVPKYSCNTEDFPTEEMSLSNNEIKNTTSTSSNCVGLFFVGDYELYNSLGGSTATQDYLNDIFNVVSALYQNESISVFLSDMSIWTSPDPFDDSGSNNGEDARNDFQAYYTSFNGNVACLITNDITTSTYGIAEVTTGLCNGYNPASFSGRYNMSDVANQTILPTYTRSVFVVTHEIGHNLGSRHTHWCGWVGGAIDNCGPTCTSATFEGSCTSAPTPAPNGGTIMSYCDFSGCSGISFANGFGTQPGNRIRSVVAGMPCYFTNGCCVASFNLNYTTNSLDIEASGTINASSNVTSGGAVKLDSGTLIILEDGFNAQPNSDFRAVIDGCGGAE